MTDVEALYFFNFLNDYGNFVGDTSDRGASCLKADCIISRVSVFGGSMRSWRCFEVIKNSNPDAMFQMITQYIQLDK